MSPALFRRQNLVRLTVWILAWLLALPALAGGPGQTTGIALAGSFAADGLLAQQRKIPILVFYSRAQCSWCAQARHEQLLPLANDPATAGRVLIREIALDSDMPLTDFSGRSTTHGAFAETRRIRTTPTLDFLDDRGNRLVEPLVGVRVPDFYGAVIERAITESLAKLRAGNETNWGHAAKP